MYLKESLLITATIPLFFAFMVGPAFAVGDAGAGKAVYEKQCKRCHADDGAGNEKLLKTLKLRIEDGNEKGIKILSLLEKSGIDMSDDDMIKLIRDGKNKMKP